MNINHVYEEYLLGDSQSESRLFNILTESFRFFVQRRGWNQQDSEEIVQEALLTISQKMGDMDSDCNFAAWAYTVLKNKLMDYGKLHKVRAGKMASLSDNNQPDISMNPNPDFKIKLSKCMRKVCQINLRFARILNLRYHGFSTMEICEKMQLTRNSLYIILSRARSMLKICLEKGEIA
jgi:RNA polymerase sigma factor (sigma-70 family)